MKYSNLTVKEQRVYNNILKDKEIISILKKQATDYYTLEEHIFSMVKDSKEYVKGIKDGRVINSIGKVSSSGMSRQIKFLHCSKTNQGYQYYNFYSLFKALGFREVKNSDGYFSISGCGMDMIFNTNYTIIHKLQSLGLISKKQCSILAQKTPQTI